MQCKINNKIKYKKQCKIHNEKQVNEIQNKLKQNTKQNKIK